METMAIITIITFVLIHIFVGYCYRYFKLYLFWEDIPIKMKRIYWLVQLPGYGMYVLMFAWQWYWVLTITFVLSIVGILYNWKFYKIMFKE